MTTTFRILAQQNKAATSPVRRRSRLFTLAAGVLIAAVLAPSIGHTITFTTLSAFYGTNGAQPAASLVAATNGNFYGTTLTGGAFGNGTVFVVSPSGALTSLASFDGTNGAQPAGPLALGSDGSLYGTASAGGASGNGTVFALTPAGALTSLVSFAGTNGSKPSGGLGQGSDGNFYGTTSQGGDYNLGTVFMVTPSGALTTLVSFNGTNGAQPFGGVVVVGTNNTLYGATSAGGQFGSGTIFRFGIAASRGTNNPGNIVFTNLYVFVGGNDGAGPQAGLVLGSDGNLYGTTAAGGTNGFGTVFSVTASGGFNGLASFDRTNGASPSSPLSQGADGNFYGTTLAGGAHNAGTVFSLATNGTNGTLTTLHSFAGGSAGANPWYAGVIQGTNGNFYGTASAGGAGASGTVYQISGFAPTIVSQPADQTVSSGTTVTFVVTASGSMPLRYQWQLNSNSLADGGKISGAASSILTISNVAQANAGSYRVIVRNTGGSVTNSGSLLTVINPFGTNRPTVAITSPRQSASLNTTLVAIRGTATGPVAVARVYFRINDGGWQLAGSSSGWANWNANVIAGQGSNVVAAYAVNVVGTPSETNEVYFTCGLTGVPVMVQISGNGVVSPNYNLFWLSPERSYSMTARPDTGNLFAGWTGSISGSAPLFTSPARVLTFTARSNLLIQANFVTNSFLKVSGVYNGLFYDTNGAVPESSGFVTLTVTTQGKFSGSLQTGQVRYSLRGQFDLDGNAQTNVNRRNASPLSMGLRLDLAGGTDQITGTLSNEDWQAELVADRSVFDGRTTNAPQAGQYTMVIPGGADSTAAPGGDGFGTIQVDKVGKVRLAGSLADGTKISQAALLSKDGQWPLYVPLYGGRGMLASWVVLSNAPSGAANGRLHWIKPAMSDATYYRNGFTNNDVAVVGSRYIAPKGQTNVLGFPLGTLVLSAGDLAQSTTNSFALLSKNKVVNLADPDLTLIFTSSSGLFRGTVAAGLPKPTPFSGIVLEDQQLGRGYFLGTNQSGRAALQGK